PAKAKGTVAARAGQILGKDFGKRDPERMGQAGLPVVADRAIFEVVFVVGVDRDIAYQQFFIRNISKRGTDTENDRRDGKVSPSVPDQAHRLISRGCRHDRSAIQNRTAWGSPKTRSNMPKTK